MRRSLAALLVVLAGCPRTTPSPAIAPVSVATKPRLVVVVVVDQWPSWSFAQQRSLFTGGIARVMREGVVVEAAEIPYANTFTAPGHATIGTGATPRATGIVGNEWFRRSEGRSRPAEYDPSAMPFVVGEPLGGTTLTQDDGASSAALRVDGVADALRAATGGAAKSLAVSFKARSAVLVAGKRPDLAVWFEPGAGGMTTSAAYTSELPGWLRDLAAKSPVTGYLDASWTPQDAALLARATGIPDDAPGENSNHGLGASFPHDIATASKPIFALQETPFADEIVVATALAGVSAMELGRDEVPDLLAISFSAHDYAGHGWGPASWEILDLTLRLDARLGELFATLDRDVGPDRWAAIITSDHGATPVVEQSRVPGARRIRYKEIVEAAEKAFAAETGSPGPWVAAFVSNHLYLDAAADNLAPEIRARALDAATTAIRGITGIAGAIVTGGARARCESATAHDRVVCEAFAPDAGDVFVFPVAGSVITNSSAGTSHDAPYDDNRRVPILVKAPGVTPGAATGSLLQVAPTAAALLDVPPPSAARAAPLAAVRR